MKQLKQTNRTILFGTFNSAKPSLDDILNEEKPDVDSIDDSIMRQIEEQLVVDSFDSFLEIFDPAVYSKKLSDGRILYSLRKEDDGFWTSTPINDKNSFVQMIFRTIDGKSGAINEEFNFEECLNLLGIEAQTRKINRIKEQTIKLRDKYLKAEEGSAEQDRIGEILERQLSDIVHDYFNPTTLFPARMSQLKNAIDQKKDGVDGESDFHSSVSNALPARELFKDGRYILEAREAVIEEEQKNLEIIDSETREVINSKTVDVIVQEEDDFGDLVANGLAQTYTGYMSAVGMEEVQGMKQMLVDTFLPTESGTNALLLKTDIRELKFEYNDLADRMEKQLQDFVNVAKQLIENVVGVKMFFEQSNIKKNDMKPQMIIANCDLDLIDKTRLRQFLNYTNNTISNMDKAIWFSIIPDVSMAEERKDDNISAGLFTSKKKKEKKKGKSVRTNNTISAVKEIIKILQEYKIQSFISFEHNSDNTFAYVKQYGIEKFQELTKSIKAPIDTYTIPCLPNFTIIPEERCEIREGRYQLSDDVSDQDGVFELKQPVNLGGVYIGAAFVAAGIVAACQSPDYLQSKKLPVIPSRSGRVPGVRFDMESHFDEIEATIGIEVSGYSNSIKQKIEETQYGFVFASEGGSKVHIMKARSLKMGDNGAYEPICIEITKTYVERLFDYNYKGKKDKNAYNEFFEGSNKKTFWDKNQSEGYVNSILQQGDSLTYEIEGDECKVKLELQKVEANITMVMQMK